MWSELEAGGLTAGLADSVEVADDGECGGLSVGLTGDCDARTAAL